MDLINRHRLVVFIVCCTSLVYNFSPDNPNIMSYFGCNGELSNSFGPQININTYQNSSLIKRHALQTRIISPNYEGGYDREHTVRIALKSEFQKAHCAGTLQNALYVITAAHCVYLVNASDIIVTAGIMTFGLEQNRSVTSFEIHKGWNKKTQKDDIALLKLNASLVLSVGEVIPAELGPPLLPNATFFAAWITGWGLSIDETGQNLTYSKYPQQIKVSLIDLKICKDLYNKIGKEVYENQICAGREQGYGPGTGDVGTPLTVKFKIGAHDRNYVLGILSSYEDVATGTPHIYTDLEKYKNWIESKAGRQCDFNIHAYDFDNTRSMENHNSNTFKRPRGRIQGSVAQTICSASNEFLRTRRIQGPLKSPAILQMFSHYANQLEGDNVCVNWQWNTCNGCIKFASVDCPSVRQDSVKLHSSSQSTRILGGNDSTPYQHPYTVRIATNTDGRIDLLACGGVIYSPLYVLTSAYCVYKRIPCSLTVTAGDYNVSDIEGSEQVRRVVSIMSHEGFVKDRKRHNDIAILKIESPFNFTTRVHSVLLATKEYPTTEVQQVELSGWGGRKSDVLQTLVIPFVSDCDCRLSYSYLNGNSMTPNKICSGRVGYGLCDEDTGYPLTVTDNATKYLVGIASTSNLCGNSPGVATKVYAYRAWIVLRAG